MRSHSSRIRARYSETDQMGVIYHANYYVWMEVARVELCSSLGFSYRDMEQKNGVLLAVVEARCRYVSPVRFDDEVTITTTIPNANARMVTFSYDMFVDDRQVACGETRHIFLNRLLKPTRIPEQYRPLFDLPARSNL